MITLKLTRIGNSVGTIIPKEALARLRVEEGDVVYLTESPDGFRITPYDPGFADHYARAEAIMERRRAVLRGLTT